MRLLVTRPAEDAAMLAGELQRAGHQALIEPLLRITLAMPPDLSLAGVAALVVTSRNGLRALAASDHLAAAVRLPLLSVGPATSEMARSLGFTRIDTGPGSARDLAGWIAAHRHPADGPLLELAGDELAYDLAADLTQRGFDLRVVVVYRSEPVRHFGQSTLAAFHQKAVDGILLLSPRTARTYAGLLEVHDLTEFAARLPHFCLSSRVADALTRAWPALRPECLDIADAPRIDRIIELVNREAANSTVNRPAGGD